MSAGVAVARWELTVRPRTRNTSSFMSHSGSLPDRPPWTGLARVAGCWRGEFLLAEVGCGSPWIDAADIIVMPQPPRSRGPAALYDRLAHPLARHPGCAIAVTGGHDWFALAARDGTVVMLSPAYGRAPQPVASYLASSVFPVVRGTAVLQGSAAMGGCLAHAWLVSGQSLALLDGTRLRMATPGRDRRWAVCGQTSGVLFLFAAVFERPEAVGRPSMRVRSRSASGASMFV